MTLTLAAELVRRGLAVDLVILGRADTLLSQVPPEVRVLKLDAYRSTAAVGKLRRYLRMECPTAILSAAWEANIVTMLASLGLKPKPRIVLSVRNTFSLALAGGSLSRRVMRLATRLLYPLSHRVAVVSKGAARDLSEHARLDSNKVVAIYNPALPGDFDILASEPAVLLPDPQPGRARIITVGRLAPAKDHATLIRAFAQVARLRPAELILFGEGEMRSSLERLVAELGLQELVTFAGLVRNPFPYMRQADLFVFSSAWEGFGNVLVEALAAEVPVVATDCPHGPYEILEGGKWGKLVPPGDPEALATAMLETLTHPPPNGRLRAREFTVERIADQYLELLMD